MWSIEFLDQNVVTELDRQPSDIKAKFFRIVSLIEANGLERVREHQASRAFLRFMETLKRRELLCSFAFPVLFDGSIKSGKAPKGKLWEMRMKGRVPELSM